MRRSRKQVLVDVCCSVALTRNQSKFSSTHRRHLQLDSTDHPIDSGNCDEHVSMSGHQIVWLQEQACKDGVRYFCGESFVNIIGADGCSYLIIFRGQLRQGNERLTSHMMTTHEMMRSQCLVEV